MAIMNELTGSTPRILVVNGHAFQRRLVGETLRTLGSVEITYAETGEQCLLALNYAQPDMLIIDWRLADCDGLALVARIRAGEVGEDFRRVPVITTAERMSTRDLERARNVGVDEFVIRPFSTATMIERVLAVRANRREFIESPRYAGPCRRRIRPTKYDGPRRRLFDAAQKDADAPEVQIRKGLARMYCERITTLLAAVSAANTDSMRDLCLACGQLSALTNDMSDRLLLSAASSMFNYVKGVGAESVLNTEVVEAHIAAIVQLTELPDSQAEVRQTVTQQLTVMVTKKLRQAA